MNYNKTYLFSWKLGFKKIASLPYRLVDCLKEELKKLATVRTNLTWCTETKISSATTAQGLQLVVRRRRTKWVRSYGPPPEKVAPANHSLAPGMTDEEAAKFVCATLCHRGTLRTGSTELMIYIETDWTTAATMQVMTTDMFETVCKYAPRSPC